MTRNAIASIPLLPITVCFSFGIILYVYGLGLVSGVILLLAAIFFAFRNSYYRDCLTTKVRQSLFLYTKSEDLGYL